MKIPKTTKDKPYIECRFDKHGNMTLSATSNWWGNTCQPKDLDKYIVAFKRRKMREIEKEIESLQKRLKAFKASRVKSIKKEIANLQKWKNQKYMENTYNLLIAKYNQK